MDLVTQLPDVQKVLYKKIDLLDNPVGLTLDADMFSHLTDFPEHFLPVYLTAIQHSGLNPKDFAISDWVIGEIDMEIPGPKHFPEMKRGLYYRCDSDELKKFIQAVGEVIEAHPGFKY